MGRRKPKKRLNWLQRQPRWKKRQIERRRTRYFEGELNFERKRRNNRKRALYSVPGREGTNYKTKVLERHPKGRTIIDVFKILKNNTNN